MCGRYYIEEDVDDVRFREALDALNRSEIVKGDVAVLRYLGPKGAFGTTAYVFQKADYLTRANLVKWQNQGLRVGVWTINDADAIRKWLDMGVDFLTSNYPKLTTAEL